VPLVSDVALHIATSSVTRAIDVVGDRWALLILRDAFQGARRFEEFVERTGATRATLTNRLRARALMAHALAEATLGFLEGQEERRVIDRCRVPAWRAYVFDPKVDERWSGRLSPKLLKVLEEVRIK